MKRSALILLLSFGLLMPSPHSVRLIAQGQLLGGINNGINNVGDAVKGVTQGPVGQGLGGLVGGVLGGGGSTAPAGSSDVGLVDEGAGIYTDLSVVEQASTFTLNPFMVSCGVGTLVPGGAIGPFEMVMFSTNVDTYQVQRTAPKRIIATGKMRSITRVAGLVVEDTDGLAGRPAPHDFIALGEDNSPQTDRFSLHFKTPFWKPGNPMCTMSNLSPDLCMFGGNLVMGGIVVAP